MEKHKKCSFFGHRNVVITEKLKNKVTKLVENLIINENVNVFLFGSCSNFDYLCHLIVTELKEKYPKIKRISYTCQSEGCYLEKDRKGWEEYYSRIEKREVKILCFEEEFEHKNKYTAGRASYVERNQAMIDDSDYCIFYYDEDYQPTLRKYAKRCVYEYQPKSGTALAYKYAKRKKKLILNITKNE